MSVAHHPDPSRRLILAAVTAVVLTASSAAGVAADSHIDIRLSIKCIRDTANNRATGFYGNDQNIRDVIDATNRAMARWQRGYRFVVHEVVDVTAPGSDLYFNVNDVGTPTSGDLETVARADPTNYLWRDDAVNIYIVNCCGAGAGIPFPDTVLSLVFFSAGANDARCDPGQNPRQTLWAHEIGHHFGLIHPWDGDEVADTQPEPSPFQCAGTPPPPCPIQPPTSLPFGCAPGGSGECCCTSKIANLRTAADSLNWTEREFDDLRFNVMGYMNAVDCVALGAQPVTIETMRLTEGQLDRWTDATRHYRFDPLTRVGEVTGLTYFVDGTDTTEPFTGYSTDPYSTVDAGVGAAYSGGGDIVMIRAGNYPEDLTLRKPVTLRAAGGTVRIGP